MMANNRFLEYVDTSGNTWQSLVEQFEYGYWVREGYRGPWSSLWHHFPVSEEARFETSQEAREYAEKLRVRRVGEF